MFRHRGFPTSLPEYFIKIILLACYNCFVGVNPLVMTIKNYIDKGTRPQQGNYTSVDISVGISASLNSCVI